MGKYLGSMPFRLQDILPLCEESSLALQEIEDATFFDKGKRENVVFLYLYSDGSVSNGKHFSCFLKDM